VPLQNITVREAFQKQSERQTYVGFSSMRDKVARKDL
jgi:hypothetical protein